jgi:hypothetical protein
MEVFGLEKVSVANDAALKHVYALEERVPELLLKFSVRAALCS